VGRRGVEHVVSLWLEDAGEEERAISGEVTGEAWQQIQHDAARDVGGDNVVASVRHLFERSLPHGHAIGDLIPTPIVAGIAHGVGIGVDPQGAGGSGTTGSNGEDPRPSAHVEHAVVRRDRLAQ